MAAVTPSTSNQVLSLRRRGGFARLPQYALVEVTGPDAGKYLQARLSNDVNLLNDGQGQMTSLLDRKAYLIAWFSLHRVNEQRYLLLMEAVQVDTVLRELEMYHFREDVSFARLDWPLWTVQGGAVSLLEVPAESGFETLERSFTGDSGLVVASTAGGANPFSAIEAIAHKLDMVELDADALNTARVEGGIPLWGVDFGPAEVLPETGLENIGASYSKGCFQGQEVLARVRTYGAPKRGLVGLVFDSTDGPWPVDTPLFLGEQQIGVLKSNVASPTLERIIALAYVAREHRVPDTELHVTIGGAQVSCRVVALPFYDPESRKKQAREVYERALNEFTVGSEVRAIEQLREAIKLDPFLSDAYEALGVALSRQEELDEAIAVMKQLDRLEPESIMAHANLSVFYMQKGDKEAAEEEKAKAMSIRMSLMARDFAAQQKQEEELRRRKAEAEQRMAMFRQVLEIDADDFLANAGMGGALVDIERHEEAVPYLQKALQVRPTHTVAYVSLAQALEHLGRVPEAIAVYEQGVAIAAQRGDLTPMKAMQAELQRLQAQG